MTTEQTWQVGAFYFTPGTHLLSGPEGNDVLEPKASALLAYLIAHRGQDISRDELIRDVWGGHIVSDGAINRVIVRLRRALDDNKKPRQYIVTVPKVGYRFVAPVNAHVENPVEDRSTAKAQQRYQFPLWLVGFLMAAIIASYFALKPKPLPLQSAPTFAPVVRLSSLQFNGIMAPDGEQFVYSQRTGQGTNLYWLENEDANPRRIGAIGGTATSARWSPDGSSLVYVYLKGDSCSFHRLDMQHPLTAEPETIYTCRAVRGIPLVYNLDGSKLFFGEKTTAFAPFELFELDLTTRSKRRLSQPVPKARGHYWLDVHPVHGRLLMLSETSAGETTAYQLNPNTEEYKQLIHWPYKIDTAVWSHRGGTIVHQGQHPSYTLVETKLTSGETNVLVADSRRMMHPQRIRGGRDYSFTSYIYNRDLTLNGEPVEWLNSSVMDYLPTLSHSGRKLAFISKRSGESQLFIKDFDTERLVAVDLPKVGRALYGIDWSFRDDRILLTTSNDLLIIDVAQATIANRYETVLPPYGATWSGADSFTFSTYENRRWQVHHHDLISGTTTKLEPRWAFVLTSPDTQLFIDQNYAINWADETQAYEHCAAPMHSYTLTMRLDGDTFYCIDPDDPQALIKMTRNGSTTTLRGVLHPSTRHYSVSGEDIAQAYLHDAVSDIMRTRFPPSEQ